MRRRIKSLLKPLHDRLFDRWVYEQPTGRLQGIKRRGRPPWLLRSSEDPRLDRELRFLDSLPLAGGVAYDVGGNLGAHSVLLHRLVGPGGQVHVFEPDPYYCQRLLDLQLLNDLPNFEVHSVGLGVEAGSETLVVPDGSRIRMAGTVSADFKATLSGELSQRSMTVRMTSLDAYRAALDLPLPTFLKVDVEGFEKEVLAGAQDTLRHARPIIMVEIHGLAEDSKRKTMRHIIESLRPLNYSFEHLETGAQIAAGDEAVPIGGHLIARPLTAAGPA